MRLKNYLTMLACMVGMSAWALEPVDGVYQLATAQDLVDFAELINAGGTTDVKAVLTADIDMSDYPTCLIGNDRGTPFSGEFDGQATPSSWPSASRTLATTAAPCSASSRMLRSRTSI